MISRDILWRDPHRREARRSRLGAHPLVVVSTAFVLVSMGYLWAVSPGQHATIASPVPQVPFGIPDERAAPAVKPEARAAAANAESVAATPIPPARPLQRDSVALAASPPEATADTADVPGDDEETGAVALPPEEPVEPDPVAAAAPLAPAPEATPATPALQAAAIKPSADHAVSGPSSEPSPPPAKEQIAAAPAAPIVKAAPAADKIAPPSQAAQVLPAPVKPRPVKKRKPAAADVPPEVMAAVRRLSRERAQRRNAQELARRQWEYGYGAPVNTLPPLSYGQFRGRGGAGPYYYETDDWM
jgi:hypothetical protein